MTCRKRARMSRAEQRALKRLLRHLRAQWQRRRAEVTRWVQHYWPTWQSGTGWVELVYTLVG